MKLTLLCANSRVNQIPNVRNAIEDIVARYTPDNATGSSRTEKESSPPEIRAVETGRCQRDYTLDNASSPKLLHIHATLIAMSAKEILSLVGAEIANLQQARALIIGTGTKKLGQPKSVVVPEDRPKKKRTMSPEGRARIAAAMKARWAAKKKAAK